MPGEARLVHGGCILRTLLGSCVGVTFWAPRLGVAALCHGMLPRAPLSGPGSRLSEAAALRYVDFAIRHLAGQLSGLGVERDEVQVKLFGGADVLDVGGGVARPTVGKLNCESAIRVLGAEGISWSASSLGGTSGIDLHFNTLTGEVLLRRLGKAEDKAHSVPGASRAAGGGGRSNQERRGL